MHFHLCYFDLDQGIKEAFNTVGFLRDDNRLEFDTETALDAAGNIYVTRGSRMFKYTPDGEELWRVDYDSKDLNYVGLAIDDESNVFVTGSGYHGLQFDFVTTKYSQSNTVSCQLTCLPFSGTVPFDTTIAVSAVNEVPGDHHHLPRHSVHHLTGGEHTR